MHLKAKGTGGENIGAVKDVVVDPAGKTSALIISHGGVLGIGDKALRVPVDQVKPDPKADAVAVPIAKNNVDSFRLRQDRPTPGAQAEMKVSALLDDQIYLGETRYGEVEDFIIGPDGRVKAVIVDAEESSKRGRVALPWQADTHDLARNRFSFNYDRNAVEKLRPFDYAALGIAAPGGGAASGTDPGRTATGGTSGRTTSGSSGAATGGAR
jgi:sporulation protein YlmC with PRC-barrel domain